MVWDPFGTIGNALWITGGQWAGKSTVARLLADRYAITAYHYDYHDSRAHNDRRTAQRIHLGQPPEGPALEQMAADTLAGFSDRFAWVLDDLRALVSGRPILAEGWGLRPDLVAPLLDSPRRMVVLVPTDEFRQHQVRTLPRAGRLSHEVSDPERAQRNRIDRDRILAQDAVRAAGQFGIRVIEVDGSQTAENVADLVAEHFGPYLGLAATAGGALETVG